jgi:Domain of unknown function (DUF4436)
MMWNRAAIYRVLFILLVLAMYVSSLVYNYSERERRSLKLQEEFQDSDQVHVSVRIVEANPTASEVTARLSFRLSGKIAKDAVTPAVDVRVLLNSVRGPQYFDFPKGRRINPIFAVFSVDGNVNRYPLDRHLADIWIIMTSPTQAPLSRSPSSDGVEKPITPAETPSQLELAIAELLRNQQIPLSLDCFASIPGLDFKGTINETQARDIDHIELIVRRTNSVIVLSFLSNLLMMALAISVLLMAVRATAAHRELDLLPLSLSITLIFGLPALRNTQPGVPPLGAICDYISFIWAENIVAVSAIVIMGTWLRRSRRPETKGSE